jgi:hypothetical protein
VSPADALRALPSELKLAGGAAIVLVLTLALPWYEKSAIPPGQTQFQTTSVTGLGAFSFVEGAVLLVAAGVLYLVWARSQRKGFHLPGGDGMVISVAGGWALLLVIWRMFDTPDIKGAAPTVGIRPGIFIAALAAGALVAVGARVRAAHRPEPPNPAAAPTSRPAAEPAPPPPPSPDRLF